jgi:hypothetical protein
MWRFGPLPLGAAVVQSAALGGSASTGQQGAFTKTFAVALSGSSSTASAGTLKPDRSKPLTTTDSEGTQTRIVSAAGNMGATQSDDTPIFGETSTVSAGTLTFTHAPPLSGSASTTGIGSVGVGNTPTQIVLGALTASAGTVTPSGFDVTVDLNAGEVEMVAAVGSVGTASPITTSAITSALNSFAAILNTPTDTLLGISSTFGQGTMAANQDVEDTYISSGSGAVVANPQQALTGTAITVSAGDVTATEDTTLDLVGEASTVSAGDVGFSNEFALTGAEILGEQYYVGAPGYAELTGAESIMSAGTVRDFTGEDRDFQLVGQGIVMTSDTALPVDFIMQPLDDNLITSEQYLYNVDVALEGIQIEVGQGRIKLKSNQGGGHPHGPGKDKDKKKKKKVMVDGQHFEVDEDELKDLLQLAKEMATAKAKEEADAAVAAMVAAKSSEKIKLKVPKVTGSEELKDAIADIYMQATIDAEVSRNRQLDEEEALVLLLLN